MARYGKRKLRNRTIIGSFIVVIIIIISLTCFFQIERKINDPGYGKIIEVEND